MRVAVQGGCVRGHFQGEQQRRRRRRCPRYVRLLRLRRRLGVDADRVVHDEANSGVVLDYGFNDNNHAVGRMGRYGTLEIVILTSRCRANVTSSNRRGLCGSSGTRTLRASTDENKWLQRVSGVAVPGGGIQIAKLNGSLIQARSHQSLNRFLGLMMGNPNFSLVWHFFGGGVWRACRVRGERA